jgi:hypothetical protein
MLYAVLYIRSIDLLGNSTQPLTTEVPMRTILMATVAASLILTSTAANAQEHRRNDGTGRIVAGAIIGGLLGAAVGALDNGHHGYYYRDGRRYSSAPGHPYGCWSEWYDSYGYYHRQLRTCYNNQEPEYVERPVVVEEYSDHYDDGPRASAQPPPIPGFYVDPRSRMTPCGLEWSCLKQYGR